MIKNEKQYKISNKKLQALNESISARQGDGGQLPARDRLMLTSLQVLRDQIQNEVAEYDRLKAELRPISNERSIDELPDLLIELKIQLGLTQKEFSRKIGMKEQQLQRYEADNYSNISFKNLLKILHAAGLQITVKGAISDDSPSVA